MYTAVLVLWICCGYRFHCFMF